MIARRGKPAVALVPPDDDLVQARRAAPTAFAAIAGALDEFDESAAQRYGTLRAGLEADGRRLAEPDLRIAAIALSRGATLTGNVRHFARVPELHIENWLVEETSIR